MKWANIQLHMVSIRTLLSAPLGTHMNYLTFSSNWSCKQNVSQASLKNEGLLAGKVLRENVLVVQVWGPGFKFLKTHGLTHQYKSVTPVLISKMWRQENSQLVVHLSWHTGQQTSRAHISRWKAVMNIQSCALMPTYLLWHTRTHTHRDIYMHTHGG